MNLGNILTLLVRLDLYPELFESLTFKFVLAYPSSLSCIYFN